MKNIREISIWKEKPQDGNVSLSALENIGIEALQLNPRSYNGLKRGGITSIAQVIALAGEDGLGEGIKHVRNLGDKSVQEIMDKLALFMEDYKAVHATSYSASNSTKKVLLKPGGTTWNRDIVSINLSPGTADKFRQSGIYRVGDIYSPVIKDPGWLAVRELFDKLINEAS